MLCLLMTKFLFHVFLYSRYNTVDINVAVATDEGLITPIVFRADNKVNSQKKTKQKKNNRFNFTGATSSCGEI